RFRTKPAMRRIAENFRRIERREIRSPIIVVALKGRPRRIDDEPTETQENQQRLYPPRVAPLGLPKATLGGQCSRLPHDRVPPKVLLLLRAAVYLHRIQMQDRLYKIPGIVTRRNDRNAEFFFDVFESEVIQEEVV